MSLKAKKHRIFCEQVVKKWCKFQKPCLFYRNYVNIDNSAYSQFTIQMKWLQK